MNTVVLVLVSKSTAPDDMLSLDIAGIIGSVTSCASGCIAAPEFDVGATMTDCFTRFLNHFRNPVSIVGHEFT